MPENTGSPTLTTLYRDRVDVPAVGLVVTQPDGSAQEYRLGIESLIIGAGDGSDVVLVDGAASRRPCSIAMGQSGVVLTDLGSKNGTFVNGVRVEHALLEPGHVLSIGRCRLDLVVHGGGESLALTPDTQFGGALGGSVAMRSLFARLARAAASPETVLLLGESGTGKELLARALHEHSPRQQAPFVVLDCSALAPTLVEAEIFGHARGAFTGAVQAREGVFEQAHCGTLFIDEIGELPPELQPKLLRALESGEVRRLGENAPRSVDVRVIAATHRDIRGRVQSGEFRQDLYYRLAVVEASIPPLRERKDDIPMLTERFLRERTPPLTLQDLPPNTLSLLGAHDWPGNVRELRNTVARLVLYPEAPEAAIAQTGQAGGDDSGALYALPLGQARAELVERFELRYIEQKLADSAGNVTQAAQAAGVSRQFFHRLMSKYGVERS